MDLPEAYYHGFIQIKLFAIFHNSSVQLLSCVRLFATP